MVSVETSWYSHCGFVRSEGGICMGGGGRSTDMMRLDFGTLSPTQTNGQGILAFTDWSVTCRIYCLEFVVVFLFGEVA
jgi:hypothetical protein